jgi:ankyrin repeat protein
VAAAENNTAAIKVLVAAGANVHEASAGRFTPLLFAVRGGHVAASRALLNAGADPNKRMPDGMSALVLAIYNAHYELAAFLLDRGTDPNASARDGRHSIRSQVAPAEPRIQPARCGSHGESRQS